jgi:hypothetical protein
MSTQTKTEFTSSQGQRAGALQLHFEELTENEQLLVSSLAIEGRPVRNIKEIMEDLNWHRIKGGRARGCSRVRNTLRRLVRSQWVTHESEVGDGKYRLTKNALDRLRRLVKETEPAKPAKVATTKPKLTVVPAPATEQEF